MKSNKSEGGSNSGSTKHEVGSGVVDSVFSTPGALLDTSFSAVDFRLDLLIGSTVTELLLSVFDVSLFIGFEFISADSGVNQSTRLGTCGINYFQSILELDGSHQGCLLFGEDGSVRIPLFFLELARSAFESVLQGLGKLISLSFLSKSNSSDGCNNSTLHKYLV